MSLPHNQKGGTRAKAFPAGKDHDNLQESSVKTRRVEIRGDEELVLPAPMGRAQTYVAGILDGVVDGPMGEVVEKRKWVVERNGWG